MIIQICGTSGSGKSHLMRSFLKLAKKVELEHIKGRAAPISYYLPKQDLVILGAYDAPTGGCDTIHDIAQVFGLVRRHHEAGVHVLFEGLFCMNQTRAPQLAQEVGKNYVVLQLTTPLATCLASINARRAERGEEALETKKNTIDNYKRAENFCYRMRDAGARVIKVDREEALAKIQELLRGV